MGNIKSCCKETISDNDDREERSRILSENCDSYDDIYNDSTHSQRDNVSYGSVENDNDGKTIEQSALERIYHKMASNLIDVAPGEAMVMQPAEFAERQKAYQVKLNQIKTPLPLRFNDRVANNAATNGLTNHALPNSQVQEIRRVEYEPISVEDINLITDISERTYISIKNLKIISKEPVVTYFQP